MTGMTVGPAAAASAEARAPSLAALRNRPSCPPLRLQPAAHSGPRVIIVRYISIFKAGSKCNFDDTANVCGHNKLVKMPEALNCD